MLYLIGLGLGEKDISLKALEALKQCDAVYCEFYTGVWNGSMEALETAAGRKVTRLQRQDVESDLLVSMAKAKNVALLIPGDPLAATTHFQLVLDAREAGVHTRVMHAPSIFTAIAETGLHLYKFGRTTTLVRDYAAASPYEMIQKNREAGLHSLVLLDIGMTAQEGAALLVANKAVAENEKILACSHLGTEKAAIVYDTAKNIRANETPAVIIIPGILNFKEEEALALWQ